MRSRREFLTTVAAGLGAAALRTEHILAAGRPEIRTVLKGRVGLQLWSLREYGPKDVPGTLARVHEMGFRHIESAGLWGKPIAEFRSAIDKAGLTCLSSHFGLERLRDDLSGALAEARGLGATDVVCPWIPHDKVFTRDDALKAADAFNRVGKAARDAGLRFAYHCHGYEMVQAPEGTLFDALAGAADASLVDFQVDTFHAYHGGADPVRLIEKYATGCAPCTSRTRRRARPWRSARGTLRRSSTCPWAPASWIFPPSSRPP